MKLLLIEDDAGIAELLQLALTGLGHDLIWAEDGSTGLELAARHVPDAILLDVMMPGVDGFETLRRLRADSDRALALTARTDPIDIVAGLECGADDYVTKPVEPRALDARVKAILRRVGNPTRDDTSSTLEVGELRIGEAAMRISRSSRPVDLTATELKLLLTLVRHLGQVLTRHQLLAEVWDYGFAGDSRLVDEAIQRLRAKIEPVPAEPTYIHTVRGIVYRMDRP